jgi:hypothetical protein
MQEPVMLATDVNCSSNRLFEGIPPVDEMTEHNLGNLCRTSHDSLSTLRHLIIFIKSLPTSDYTPTANPISKPIQSSDRPISFRSACPISSRT